MLIDWVTAKLHLSNINSDLHHYLSGLGDRIVRFCPFTGETRYELTAWDSIRSDSHSLAYKVSGEHLYLQGSPARVEADGDSVFGGRFTSALDLQNSLQLMINKFCSHFTIILPVAKHWKISRVDVTNNLYLPSLSDVRSALTMLRDCEGGRYRVSAQAGDSVYWSKTSALRKGKAYAKGPHLGYLMNKKGYDGYQYSDQQIEQAGHLLRLELTLGSQFWRERADFKTADANFLREQWESYFGRMLGAETVKTDNLLSELEKVAKTKGQAKATYAFFLLLNSVGWEIAKEMTSKSTFYHHLKNLRAAGLGDMDISKGRIVEFRRPLVLAEEVTSWHQLNKLIA